MNATRPYWGEVNIGSGNGLVPSGNKPLPEPMLTQIYDPDLIIGAQLNQDHLILSYILEYYTKPMMSPCATSPSKGNSMEHIT